MSNADLTQTARAIVAGGKGILAADETQRTLSRRFDAHRIESTPETRRTCQDRGIVPIVEPEMLMDSSHDIERCEDVTAAVLHAVFDELFEQPMSLEGMVLKPHMVIAGTTCPMQAPPDVVAASTLRCLLRNTPAAVPGILFLSGGQDHVAATRHLSLINQQPESKPWKLSFSYGRALQDEALTAWAGRDEHVPAAQWAFCHRARCDAAAATGLYSDAMEGASAAV